MNAIIKSDQYEVTARSFDTSILAGTKSPNTIEQYKMHFASYCDFAGSFDAATQPATLAQWRQELFEQGYTAKNGQSKDYSVNAINQRLAAIRGVMMEAAQQGYITRQTADDFKGVMLTQFDRQIGLAAGRWPHQI